MRDAIKWRRNFQGLISFLCKGHCRVGMLDAKLEHCFAHNERLRDFARKAFLEKGSNKILWPSIALGSDQVPTLGPYNSQSFFTSISNLIFWEWNKKRERAKDRKRKWSSEGEKKRGRKRERERERGREREKAKEQERKRERTSVIAILVHAAFESSIRDSPPDPQIPFILNPFSSPQIASWMVTRMGQRNGLAHNAPAQFRQANLFLRGEAVFCPGMSRAGLIAKCNGNGTLEGYAMRGHSPGW